jgi:hypothetical protein
VDDDDGVSKRMMTVNDDCPLSDRLAQVKVTLEVVQDE